MTRGGFTLIEIVVVLLILGVVAAVTVPALGRLQERQTSSESAAREIAQLLRTSRRTAVNHGVAVVVVVDPVHRGYRIETQGNVQLSKKSPIVREGKLDLPQVRFVGDFVPYRFRFDRLGTGHGPMIHLESESGDRASVSVTSWTGEPWVETYASAQE